MKNGFTLLEVLVVIGIIAVLSLIGVNSVNSFRQEAVLESTVNEFVTVLKTAKNKSMAGEIPEGKTADKFSSDGLPVYGVEVKSGTYFLTRSYNYDGSSVTECQSPEGVWISDCSTYLVVPSELVISPDQKVEFSRISGITPYTTSFSIQKVSGGMGKTINISSDGIVTVY